MTQRISRRTLLSGAIKTGVGLAIGKLTPSLTVGLLPRSAKGAQGIARFQNDSPWFGSTRIFVRKGKLTVDGAPVTPLGGGIFRVGAEDWSPERLTFGPVVNGRATRMKFSGVEFHRTFTP